MLPKLARERELLVGTGEQEIQSWPQTRVAMIRLPAVRYFPGRPI
jgi:hypothetical protein